MRAMEKRAIAPRLSRPEGVEAQRGGGPASVIGRVGTW
eukprot:gene14329-53992_t